MNILRLSPILYLLTSSLAMADNFPLCSSNEVADYSVQSGSFIMKMCYAQASSMKVKIFSISLLKQDGSSVSFYSPASPEYTDLAGGIADLATNVTPVSGAYTGLRVHMDAEWKITASSDYTPSSGSAQYCRTQQNANVFGSTNWSMDIHTTKLAGTNVGAVETLYKHNAFSFIPVVSGSVQPLSPQSDSAYFSRLLYTINANGVTTIDHYLVDANGQLETSGNNVVGEIIDVTFSSPIQINTDTDSTYTINFDLTRSIGFAHEVLWNGNMYYRSDNKCAFMTVGPLPITLTVE